MRYSYYSICSKIIISNITVYCNVLFINSSSFLHSSDLLKFSANSFITSRCLFFLLRLSPLLIPPFLPISRSSSGLRSVFGIKLELFTWTISFHTFSRFVRASLTVQDTVSPLIFSLCRLFLPILHKRGKRFCNLFQLLICGI